MSTPVSYLAARTIGTVESVAPDEVYLLLETDAPRSVALNTGVPTPFPRINSFVLVPSEVGAMVGLVVWLGVERSAFPKRQGFKDFGLIDLPFPLRKLALCPVGTLRLKSSEIENAGTWELERGIQGYPSVGDAAVLPTREQVVAIVTGTGVDGRMHLGTCPSAHGAKVTVDPDKLFGRHLAVLGNTGSGKSCTVAALIRTAVEGADSSKVEGTETPNARFIVLDPNGEYASCFGGLGKGCRVFQVPPIHNSGASEFTLPAWMWNSAEWAAIAQAAPKTQRPLLQSSLRVLRSGGKDVKDIKTRIWGRCHASKNFLAQFLGKGTQAFADKQNVGEEIEKLLEDMIRYRHACDEGIGPDVDEIVDFLEELLRTHPRTGSGRYFPAFSDGDIDDIIAAENKMAYSIGTVIPNMAINEDSPIPFSVDSLCDTLEAEGLRESASSNQYLSTLIMRIRTILADSRMRDVTCPDAQPTLLDWLNNHIGKDKAANGQVAVLDLSLVPAEILHLVIAVSGRLILEALQRYRRANGGNLNLPTVIVLEEAHTFIAKHLPQRDEIPSPADMCRQVFERIAREGRKFGLGLVLSSQRPSEVSETVLSQCNSFLLHRITNDKDQELVSRLVPDNSRGLLRELPSLPSRNCFLLGIASRLPLLVEIPMLEERHRPQSADPAFWDVWTGRIPRNIDWGKIADEWQGTN